MELVETLRNNLMPYLSGAKLRVIADAGHLVPLEAPERLVATIAQFRPVH